MAILPNTAVSISIPCLTRHDDVCDDVDGDDTKFGTSAMEGERCAKKNENAHVTGDSTGIII
jgi:hypothetical protein